MSDPGVLMLAEIHGRAGLADELRAVFAELARDTLAERDCVEYRVLRGNAPGEYVLLGAWSSSAGLIEAPVGPAGRAAYASPGSLAPPATALRTIAYQSCCHSSKVALAFAV